MKARQVRDPACAIDGCELPHEARGYCNPHYQRWYKYGDPLHTFPTVEERFWSRVDRSRGPDGCWPWTGTMHASGKTGYGWTGRALAHRRAYEIVVGPIPGGHELDHTCHTAAVLAGTCAGGNACTHRQCVNPAHLEPVTPRENALRGMAPTLVTHRTGVCQRGHKIEGDNLYIVPKTGAHRCLACVAIRTEARRAAA